MTLKVQTDKTLVWECPGTKSNATPRIMAAKKLVRTDGSCDATASVMVRFLLVERAKLPATAVA
jgi:hypothetical protein